jgi:hypothetical protein
MRKITITAIILCSIGLASCQRGCSSLNRMFQVSERNYEIIMFSGGDTVFHDSFIGILNNSEGSDGVYYYKDGKLIEISGDYVVNSDK